MEKFAACFAGLEDPREANTRHDLLKILIIGFCTMLCGGKDRSEMAAWPRQGDVPASVPAAALRHSEPRHI